MRTKTSCLTVALVVVSVLLATSMTLVHAQGTVVEEWVDLYDGPASDDDWGDHIALDGSGNVYVAGLADAHSDRDIVTIKYSNSGVRQWVGRYSASGTSHEEFFGMAVDGSGSVYVTGSTFDSASDPWFDWVTIKYSSAGDQLWVRTYGTPGVPDQAFDIEADDSANVYVTGYTTSAISQQDYTTVKYNSSGILQWARSYDKDNGLDEAEGIAVDAAANVYVTGRSKLDIYTDEDWATIKYDSGGDQQWVAEYAGPGSSYDWPTDITVDSAGNVYVTGLVGQFAEAQDIATVKYNSGGVEQWVETYNGPANRRDGASAIAVDGAGNVYVTGGRDATLPHSSDCVTIKYNALGVEQWVAVYDGGGFDGCYDLALDGSANVYVAGAVRTGSGTGDIVTMKYDTAGSSQWTALYDGPGDGDDWASSIAVDNSGNAYVTGSSPGIGSGDDIVTIKYVPSPPAPDLVVSSMAAQWVEEGSTYTVTFKVCNTGNLDAGTSVAGVYVDGTHELDSGIGLLNPGSCTDPITVGPFTLSGESDSIEVRADDNDEVAESNEQNNSQQSSMPPTGGCFIATAACGPDDSAVETLRSFRDSYMKTDPVGQGLVSTYYKLSPPIAQFIDDHPALKPAVRAALLPAVGMSEVAVGTGWVVKVAIFSTLVLVSALSLVLLRRRARQARV